MKKLKRKRVGKSEKTWSVMFRQQQKRGGKRIGKERVCKGVKLTLSTTY